MKLTASEMNDILDTYLGVFEEDRDVVAIEFEFGDDGDILAIRIKHRDPANAKISEPFLKSDDRAPGLPVKLVASDEIVEEIGGPNDTPLIDKSDSAQSAGMAGTTVREGGYWGTLSLYGGSIRIAHDSIACEVDGPFLLSNSHVMHAAGRTVQSDDYEDIGTVDRVGDLEGRITFDAGVARAHPDLKASHNFLVFSADGQPKKIVGLRTVEPGISIAKQGARTGWSSGRSTGPARIRVRGHKAIYPCWGGTYRAKGGDSGSPVLHQDQDGWYLVGIHFASGPYYHSWDNADISAEPLPAT